MKVRHTQIQERSREKEAVDLERKSFWGGTASARTRSIEGWGGWGGWEGKAVCHTDSGEARLEHTLGVNQSAAQTGSKPALEGSQTRKKRTGLEDCGEILIVSR